MDWRVPFVIYRVKDGGLLEEVFLAQDFKAATYWLSYIAQPGDVLCKTPLHKKHSHVQPNAEYWSHKGSGRDLISDEELWKRLASQNKFSGQFPAEQNKESV